MKLREEIFILGMDLSLAFDTVNRAKLLQELRSIIDDDSWKMVHILLDNISLRVKIQNALSVPFSTNKGVPQGDCLSPVLFNINLELVMRQIRESFPSLFEDTSIPHEIIYADDTDFISKSKVITSNHE